MNKRISFTAICFLLAVALQAEAKTQHYEATSADHRTAMLELYTSEGCSSCPPAERWLSGLKAVNDIVPLAFHVTYWNYIGWQDPFSDIRYDNRQRAIGRFNKSSTLYTPQFVLDGKDLRGGSNFRQTIDKLNDEPALVDLNLSALVSEGRARVTMSVNANDVSLKDVDLYLALYENNLVSHVGAGENDGKVLQHDFVVRQLYGPFTQSELNNNGAIEQSVGLLANWKRKDLGLVLFAEHSGTGEILQVVRLSLDQ